MTEEEKLVRQAQGYTIYEHQGKTICLNLENFDKEKFCKDWGFKEVEVFNELYSDRKVLYDPTQYEIVTRDDGYLHYVGSSSTPVQPIGYYGLGCLFEFRTDFEELDLSHWDVSNCFELCGLFYGCENLKTVNISNWDVSGCEYLSEMFGECSKLQYIDLSGWNVSSCRKFSHMFTGCISLKSLDIGGWDVGRGLDFKSMFAKCTNLETLDLSNWVVNEMADCLTMFYGCNKLFIQHQVDSSDELVKKLLKRKPNKVMSLF